MSKLSNEQEEMELFLGDYICQVRMMSVLSDTEIKVVMRRVMEESPEWASLLMDRYRKKVVNKMMKSATRDIQNDFDKQVRKIA